MRSNRVFRVGGVAFTICLALGACGPLEAADAGKLIASPEADWPQWRGPRRDAVSSETGLLDAWPEGGPKLRWKVTGLGKGWCSPIVTGGTLYICGDVGKELKIFAFNLDGKPKWQVVNGKAWPKPFPGSRASCCYSEGLLYQMNGYGRVVCLDATTGKEKWVVNVFERFGAKVPFFGAAECLLVDGNNLIVTPAGKKALVAALDKKTGETVWTGTAAPEATETAGYSSPILVEMGGQRLIVAITSYRSFASDAGTGKVLWTVGLKFTKNACNTIPVFCGDSVFISNTSRDDQSSSLLRLSPSGDKAEMAWTLPLCTTSGGALWKDGNLYIAGGRKLRGFLCLDAKAGEVKAQLPEPINASFVWADDKLFVLSADGKALLLKPTEKSFDTLGTFTLVQKTKKDAWAHPVVCGGRLYLRYHDTLFCYDVKKQPETAPAKAEEGKAQGRKCPADKVTVGGKDVLEILDLLGAKREAGATDQQLASYVKHFDGLDADRDGKHSRKEYIEDGRYLTPRARRGIFGAADNDADGFVTRAEYVLNRIITDEAKRIVQQTDADKNGKIGKAEFVGGSPLKDEQLAVALFDALDANGDGTISIPEYLRVWGGWARPDYKAQETALATRLDQLGKTKSTSQGLRKGIE